MKANIERVVSRLEEIYQCGKQDDGTYTRMEFSKEDVEGRKLFASWAEKLGMTWRIDAAGFINQVPDITKGYGNEFTVATVGTIKVTPHSVNVIPGTCTFSLEIRDQSAEMMKVIETKLHERLEEICKKYKVTYTFTPTSYHDPAPMSELVRGTIEEAVKELKYRIPKDVAVVIYRDIETLQTKYPTYTSLRMLPDIVWSTAIKLLLERIIDKRVDSMKVYLPTKLELGDSA